MTIDLYTMDPTEAQLAIEKLINSEGRAIYCKLLEEYSESRKVLIFRFDKDLSELKYNDKDIALHTLYTIDELTDMPRLYLSQLMQSTVDEDENIDQMTDNSLKNIMNEAQLFVDEHKK